MRSSSFRIISVAVSTILLVALIAVVILAVRDNSSSALPRLLTATPVASTTPGSVAVTGAATQGTGATVQTVAELGAPIPVVAGGFRVRVPAGYTVETGEAMVTLTATGESPTSGARMLLTGGPRSRFAAGAGEAPEAIFARLADAVAGGEALAVGSADTLRVAGLEGLAAPLIGETIMGQFVLILPFADQVFTMAGLAPAEVWERQAVADFLAVLNSVTFFAPETAGAPVAAAATPMPAGKTAEAAPTAPKAGAIAAAAQPVAAAETAGAETATNQAATTGMVPPTPTTALGDAPAAQSSLQIPGAVTPTPAAAGVEVAPQAADPEPALRIYSNGNFVNDIVLMRSTLWAATGGGVVAWNKNSGGYVKFTTADGITANRTVAAAVCPLPGLGVLFGSDVGIQIFDTQNGRWRIMDSTNSGMRHDDVSALWCDADDNLLVVGYGRHGLDLFDAESSTWRYLGEEDRLDVAGVRAVDVARDRSSIWMATDQGLVVYRDGEVTTYTTDNSPLAENRIETLVVDGAGAVWLTIGNTLYRTNGTEWDAFNADNAGTANFPNGRITGLDVSPEGAIWIGSDQAQICRFDPGIEGCIAFYSGDEGMATEPLTGLAIDTGGEVYYTTAGGGISQFDGEQWRRFMIANEPVPGNMLRDLAQDASGALWIAAAGGVARLSPDDDGGAQLFSPANSPLPSVDVRVVQPGHTGGMWFGGEGVSLFDGATWTNYSTADGLAGSTVQAIVVDDQGRTWIGTQTGLSIWTGNTFFNLTTQNGLPSDHITALLADGDVVWIGTDSGGLLRFQDNQLQVFNQDNIALPSNRITALAMGEDGTLYVGTERGLASFADNVMTPVAEVGEAAVAALAAGGGAVWAATAEDVLYRKEGEGWTPSTPEQLPGPQITTLLVDEAGGLWIGCSQGGMAYHGP